MKLLLLGFLLWQAANPGADSEQNHLRYERAIAVPAATATDDGQACAILDGQIYAHAAPSLKDLRVYQKTDGQKTSEVPYAVTLSESSEADTEPAKVVNLGMRGKTIVFNLEMPDRSYTDVTLDLDAHNFIASATVYGVADADPPALIKLGTYTLFDLTTQHLSRSTTLHLQEASFHKLFIELDISPAPGAPAFQPEQAIVQGANVPPSREAQTLYSMVATTSAFTQRGRQTIATFNLPARIPVERVSFAVAPSFTGNFSRDVEIVGHTSGTPPSGAETLTGNVLRVRMKQAGREISQQQLSVPATLGANLQADATVEIRVDNGDDTPLPLTLVSLEMRQRRLCFRVPTASDLTLFYGDPKLDAPVYDYARLLSLPADVRTATLAAEQPNAAFVPRPEPLRPLTERHPELLWIVLLAVVCILAVVALHSAKRMPK